MEIERLKQQLNFIIEIDKAKQVIRNTLLTDASRLENDAEHTWHMAVAAMVLTEYSNRPDLDMALVLKLIMIHDIVEIDAGDVFVYANVDPSAKADRERRAAERIFGLLPKDQAGEFLQLWQAYEDGETPEARFAQAMDSLMPVLHNYRTKGQQWQKLNVTSDKVLARNSRIVKGSTELWEYIKGIVEDAVEKGYLKP